MTFVVLHWNRSATLVWSSSRTEWWWISTSLQREISGSRSKTFSDCLFFSLKFYFSIGIFSFTQFKSARVLKLKSEFSQKSWRRKCVLLYKRMNDVEGGLFSKNKNFISLAVSWKTNNTNKNTEPSEKWRVVCWPGPSDRPGQEVDYQTDSDQIGSHPCDIGESLHGHDRVSELINPLKT